MGSNKYLARMAALIFIFLLLFSAVIWLSNQDQKSNMPPPESTPTSVAIETQYVRPAQSISKGTIITSDMLLYVKEDPNYDPLETIVTDKAEVTGKLAKIDLVRGQGLISDLVIAQTEWQVASIPVVVDRRIYFWSINGVLQAIDLENGQQIWQFIPPGTFVNRPSIYSPLTLAQDTLYLFTTYKSSANLYAVDVQTGQEKWRFERIGSWEDIPTTAPLVSDGTIYITNNNKELIQALDAETGQEKWNFLPESPVMSNLTISDDIVYFRDVDNNFYGVNAKTGAEQWQRKLESQ